MLRTLALATALLLPLAGVAAQQQGERFRYLGRIGNFAVLATEATGPRDTRKLIAIAADSTAGGPRGANNGVLEMTIDCIANRVHADRATLYRGDEQLFDAKDGSAPIPPEPESPNGVIFRYACAGQVPPGDAVWIDGRDNARHHALDALRKG